MSDVPNHTHIDPDTDNDTNEILNDYLFALLILMSCGGGLVEITKVMWKKCSRNTNPHLRMRKVTSEDELQLQNDCPICLDSYVKKQKIISLPCEHVFHSKCIREWIAKNEECPTCPNCRENIL